MNKDKNQKGKIVKKIKAKSKDPSGKKDPLVYQNKYDELQKKYNETYDSMLRATAEMENIKKRDTKYQIILRFIKKFLLATKK